MTETWYGTGRRKSAVARVRLTDGTGRVMVNGDPIEVYFPRVTNRYQLLQPLQLVEAESRFDVKATVCGGGHTGQAEAMRHGISRALCAHSADMRAPLKKAGFLTRDARKKERKKYGQPGARKRYQFSKR